MKPEPLTKKKLCPNKDHYYGDYIDEDIKSACEWVKDKMCACRNSVNLDYKCILCRVIEKAFEGVYKK